VSELLGFGRGVCSLLQERPAGFAKNSHRLKLRRLEFHSLTSAEVRGPPTAVRRRLRTTILPNAGSLEFLAMQQERRGHAGCLAKGSLLFAARAFPYPAVSTFENKENWPRWLGLGKDV
jgi:hypothetical protein